MNTWLPELKGSPRQVDWATRIRTKELPRWKKTLKPDDYALITRVNDSTWWIANRGRPVPKPPDASQRDNRILNNDNPPNPDAESQPELDQLHDERPEAAKQLTAFISDVAGENLLLKTAALALASYATGQPAVKQEAQANVARCEQAMLAIKTILRNET
jgi:hypothetical protein